MALQEIREAARGAADTYPYVAEYFREALLKEEREWSLQAEADEILSAKSRE